MHLLTQSALLQALGWSLFNSLWQMGLLWLLYQLFILVFRNVSAAVRHGLVLLLLAAGTLWSILSFVSIYFNVSDGYFNVSDGSAPSAGFILEGPGSIRSFIAALIPYGSSLYLLVSGGLLIRYCYHYIHSARLSRQGLSRIEPAFRVFVAETSRRMGIRPTVRVWLSSLVDVPVTLGFLKPVILLPLAMASHLTTQQVEAILVHELAHIRRKDFLLNLAVTLVEGLFFFNPFTRRMIADLKKEREHCCDDLVLQFRYDPHSYVSALLSVASQASQDRQTRLVVAATGSGSHQLLLQRAKRILQQQRTGDRPGARPFALLILTLLITLVTLSRPARSGMEAAAPAAPTVSVKPAEVQHAPLISNSGPASPIDRAASPIVRATGPIDRGTSPIVRATTPIVRAASPRHPAHPPRSTAKRDDYDNPDDEETLFPLLNAVAGAGQLNPEELVVVNRKDNREYSIGKSPATKTRTPKEEGQPFVPNSSFSFQSIEEDTLRPEEKLARLQVETRREIALNIQRLQLDLMAQLELVKARQKEQRVYNLPDGGESLKEQRVLIEQQLQLQRQYIQKLDELQKKLKKTQRHFTIVYI